ncbi:MAG: ABC transporter substrate-binding protein [Flavobacteriales bacterium]|jgi:peptide/nickel transport system substrate-binding protein|nr:ABC transporter substrate-binding protein [Flavobacteriales bacterium]
MRCTGAAIIAMAIVLAGCGPGPARDHANVFRYNQGEGITSLDPAQARNLENIWACDQVFDGLVELGPDLQVRPGIAHSWQIADSGRTYVFHLRPDVHFHDHPAFPGGTGRRATAHDVRYSLERLRDPRTASPGRWVLDPVLPGAEGVHAPDDSTVVIRLAAPYPPFLGLLTMVYASVVPREAVRHEGGRWRQRPVGTGPFRFFHWEEGVKLVLHKHPRYHQRDAEGRPLPYLDAVAVSFVKDRNAEFLSLVKGELDMMSGTDGAFLGELLDPLGRVREKYAHRVRTERSPALATDYLGFLIEGSAGTPWHDHRVRAAVALAIDRERIITGLYNGIGTPARGILPPGMPGAAPGGQHHDPNRARQLLAEAGHPEGRGLPPLTVAVTSAYLEMCEMIQHQLAAVGIKLVVDVLPLSTHKDGTANGDFRFFRKNWIADHPDAENFLMLFTTANRTPAGPNYTRFSDPLYDDLYQRALRTTDPGERTATYARMDSIIGAHVPAAFLLHPDVIRFVGTDVSGIVADPMNQLDLRRVRKGAPAR